MHFTPTYSSWLNQVELWFAKIERDVIARGVFTSVPDLKRKLMRYIRQYNKQPKAREVEVLRSHTAHHSRFNRYGPLDIDMWWYRPQSCVCSRRLPRCYAAAPLCGSPENFPPLGDRSASYAA